MTRDRCVSFQRGYSCQRFREAVILELGCGAGLCAMVGAHIGARVFATDYHQAVLQLCQQNVQDNPESGRRQIWVTSDEASNTNNTGNTNNSSPF